MGYTLQRDLMAQGIHCDVVAPTSIPTPRGKAIKTDRLDAGYLAQFYANGLLTIVQPPAAEQEQDRDLLRSRQNLLKHQTDLRRHLRRPCCVETGCMTKPRPKTTPTGPSITMAGWSAPSMAYPAVSRAISNCCCGS
jgi:hypothetical protein